MSLRGVFCLLLFRLESKDMPCRGKAVPRVFTFFRGCGICFLVKRKRRDNAAITVQTEIKRMFANLYLRVAICRRTSEKSIGGRK